MDTTPSPRRGRAAVLAMLITLLLPPAAMARSGDAPDWLDGDPGSGVQVASSPDGAVSVRILGQLQPRLVIFDGGSDTDLSALVAGDPDDREGFKLRRARFGVAGKLGKPFAYRLLVGQSAPFDQLDWTVSPETDGLAILDAYLEWVSTPYIQVRLGADKVPFSGQALSSSAGLQLIERAVAVESIAPPRDVGLRLHGELGGGKGPFGPEGISWTVGSYSGDGTVMSPDDNTGMLWVGRLAFNLGGGLGWSESCLASCPFALRIGGGGGVNVERESQDRFVGADISLRLWRLSLSGEYLLARRVPTYSGIEAPPFPEQFRRHGYLTQAGFMIVPATLEIAVRHDFYDDDLDDDGDYSAVRTFTGGINLFLVGGRAKVQLDYIHRFEPHAPEALANDTLMAQATLVL